MTPRSFLILAGIVLVAAGVLGFLGIIGPTAQESVFGKQWWFDNAENWAHTLLGAGAVVFGLALSTGLQRAITMLLALTSIGVAIYGLVVSKNLLGATLQNPADLVLHLVLGVWGLLAAFGGRRRTGYVSTTG